jgi:hypothetical protein
VGAVGGGEGIVAEDITKFGHFCGQVSVVFGLAGVVSGVI